MERIVLDTNILIEISRNNKAIFDKVSEISPNSIFITSVVFAEFMKGIKNKESLTPYLKFLSKFNLLYSKNESEDKFIELFKLYSLSHQPSIADMQIASICIQNDAQLFTLNQKDFSFIPELKLFN